MTTPRAVPPPAPPLTLPPNAAETLNAQAAPPHHDSQEFLRGDRHRTAQELGSIEKGRASAASVTNAGSLTHASTSRAGSEHRSQRIGASLRARSSQSSTGSRPRGRAQGRRPQWYDAVARFWGRNISVTIEDGAHRDHLGTLAPSSSFPLPHWCDLFIRSSLVSIHACMCIHTYIYPSIHPRQSNPNTNKPQP